MLATLVLAAAFAGFSAAIPQAGPAATVVSHELPEDGWSPAPTETPRWELFKRNDLWERAVSLTSGELVGYAGPDATCGYVNGELGALITCSSSSRCAAVAPVGNAAGPMGCCPEGQGNCFFISSCFGLQQVAASSCDHACQQNSNNLLCTGSASPSCYGYTWPDISATYWKCDTTSSSTKDSVVLTFNGETDDRTWLPLYYTPSGAASTNPLIGAKTSLTTTSSTTTPTPTTSAASSSSKTNVGAIVGGTIGGLALVGFGVLGIIFFCLRSRRNKRAAANPADPAVTAQTTPHGQYVAPAGYYGGEAKATGYSPGQQYNHPMSPTQHYDGRNSMMSEGSSAAPPYQQPQQHMSPIQQEPMELEAGAPQPGSDVAPYHHQPT